MNVRKLMVAAGAVAIVAGWSVSAFADGQISKNTSASFIYAHGSIDHHGKPDAVVVGGGFSHSFTNSNGGGAAGFYAALGGASAETSGGKQEEHNYPSFQSNSRDGGDHGSKSETSAFGGVAGGSCVGSGCN